jgi:hypothetical protein
MPKVSSGRAFSEKAIEVATSGERDQHHHGRRRNLAVDEVLATDGQGQQRLERAALAFAGRRVDREVQAAHQRGSRIT